MDADLAACRQWLGEGYEPETIVTVVDRDALERVVERVRLAIDA